MPPHPLGEFQTSRRNLFRIGGASAAAAIAGPLLSACNRVPDPAGGGSGDGEFTFYTSPSHVYDTWKGIVEDFEKDHGVKVNWQKFKWPDMQTKLQADFSAGNVPDLVEQPGGYRVVNFAVDGEALALDGYLAADGNQMGYPQDWHEHAAQSWAHDGKTYGIQLQLTCLQTYYNKAMLDAAGITEAPGTWDDFLAAAKELTTDSTHGFAANADPFYSWGWMMQNGVTYFDESSGDFLTPHSAAVEAMQFQADLVHKHRVSPVPVAGTDASGPRNLLTAGRAAMIITGPWDIKPIRTGKPDFQLALGQPLQKADRATAFAGAGLFIPKKSKKADLAWDLIKRMTSLEAELKLTKEAGQTMPRKSWAQTPEIASDPMIGQVAQALPHAKNWHGDLAATGKVNQVDAAYKTFYQAVVLQNQPAEAELQKFLDAARKALDS